MAEAEWRAAEEPVAFEQSVEEALDSLPPEPARLMSNVAVVVEDEPPPGAPLLGLYQGVPLIRRGSGYAAVPPDKITIFRRPLERLYGADPAPAARDSPRRAPRGRAPLRDQRRAPSELDRY